jgi:hypothetical protein
VRPEGTPVTRSARNQQFAIAEMLAVGLSRSGGSCSADQQTAYRSYRAE